MKRADPRAVDAWMANARKCLEAVRLRAFASRHKKSCSVFTLPLRRVFNKTGDNEPPVITGRQHCPLRGGNWKLHLQIALKIKSFYRNHSPVYFHFPRFRKMIVLGLLGCFLTLLEATIFPLVLLCPIFFTLKNGVKHESWRYHLYEQWQ